MEIKILPCLTQLRKGLRGTDLCARVYCDRVAIGGKPLSPDRNTPEQQAARQAMRRAGQAWRAVAQQQRQAWNQYAAKCTDRDGNRACRRLMGYGLFVMATRNRLMCGVDPPCDAPAAMPPPALEGFELLPSTEPREFVIAVPWAADKESGLRVVTRVSPPTPSPGHASNPHECRLVCGFAPESAPLLPAAGEPLVFSGARVAVEPGRRFGITLRLMRLADGIHGPECFREFRR